MDKQLDNEQFFSRLTELFAGYKNADHGSVFLSQKRLMYEQDSTTKDKLILIRATNGLSKEHREKKIKFSTLVKPEQLENFYARYATVCKTGMVGLKPRDRSKRKEKLKKKKKVKAVKEKP